MNFLTLAPPLCVWVAVLLKLRAVLGNPSDLALRAYWLTLLLLALAMTVLTSSVAVAFDGLVGIPNVARPVGHSLGLSAGLAGQSFLLLSTRDRGPALRNIGRRCCVLLCGVVVMAVFFALAPVDEEARAFTLVYADAPWIAEYRIVFMSFFGVALVDIGYLCTQLARQTNKPVVALGLRVTVAGTWFGFAYIVHGVTVLVARRAGFVYPFGGTTAVTEILVACTAMLLVSGTTMPAWGPRVGLDRALTSWSAYQTYRRLRPLWEAVTEAKPELVLWPVRAPFDIVRPRDLPLHLYRRVVEIRDGYVALRPYIDAGTVAAARREAEAAGLGEEERRSVVEAARLRSALCNYRQGRQGRTSIGAEGLEVSGGGTDLETEARWLARVATDYARSTIVRELSE